MALPDAMPNTIPESTVAGGDEDDDANSENALREAPPSAIPIGADWGNNGTTVDGNGKGL